MNPLGYHLTSLLLHAANAVVFFFVVRRILILALPGPSERGHALAVCAGVAALVFAIHPLRVESVAWVTERRDGLSGLFYLVTILVYLRACERRGRDRGWYWLAVAVFVCALLSKSMVVNLPVVLLILDVYPLRRLGGAIGWSSEPARRVYVEKIPFVLLAAAASGGAGLLFCWRTSGRSKTGTLATLPIAGIALCVVVGLGVLTWNQAQVWRDSATLWTHALAINPNSAFARNNLGLVLALQGK